MSLTSVCGSSPDRLSPLLRDTSQQTRSLLLAARKAAVAAPVWPEFFLSESPDFGAPLIFCNFFAF
jgi:hypothetical protein